MTEVVGRTPPGAAGAPTAPVLPKAPMLDVRTAAERRLRRRNAAEARFKLYGQIAILIALGSWPFCSPGS
jgi:hypothetical protein